MNEPYTSTYNEFVSGLYRPGKPKWAVDFKEQRHNFGVSACTEKYPVWKCKMFLDPGKMQEQLVITLTRVRNGNTRINYDTRSTAGNHMFQVWEAYGDLLRIIFDAKPMMLR